MHIKWILNDLQPKVSLHLDSSGDSYTTNMLRTTQGSLCLVDILHILQTMNCLFFFYHSVSLIINSRGWQLMDHWLSEIFQQAEPSRLPEKLQFAKNSTV